MLNFSQRDPRWSNMGIGHPVRKFGCYICALSMLAGKTPDNVLNILMANDCFNDAAELINEKAAKALGFKSYKWLSPGIEVMKPIIAETNFYAKDGFPQHFFIYNPDDTIVDPLDGLTKINPYNIVSFREFLA